MSNYVMDDPIDGAPSEVSDGPWPSCGSSNLQHFVCCAKVGTIKGALFGPWQRLCMWRQSYLRGSQRQICPATGSITAAREPRGGILLRGICLKDTSCISPPPEGGFSARYTAAMTGVLICKWRRDKCVCHSQPHGSPPSAGGQEGGGGDRSGRDSESPNTG